MWLYLALLGCGGAMRFFKLGEYAMAASIIAPFRSSRCRNAAAMVCGVNFTFLKKKK
jgi:hypothetical protein